MTADKHSVPELNPWQNLADHWNLIASPLRPTPQDLQRFQAAWVASLPNGIPDRRIDILSLGVTPEIARFCWAPLAMLTALDSSEPMIRAVWPGDTTTRRAVQGDWLKIPFPDASFDLVLTDGGWAALGALDRIPVLSRELRRVLRLDGRVVARHYIRPDPPDSLDALTSAVASGKIREFNVLKLRLLLAMPPDPATGEVSLPAALDTFNQLFPDRTALARQLGCPLHVVGAIDAYRGRDAGYSFASPAQLAQLCPEFTLAAGSAGDYPLADCCPVFSFTPKEA